MTRGMIYIDIHVSRVRAAYDRIGPRIGDWGTDLTLIRGRADTMKHSKDMLPMIGNGRKTLKLPPLRMHMD